MGKVHLVSLGCPKNLVDSEKLLKKLESRGLSYCSDADESDIVMVNTCGFIEDARRESVEEILRAAGMKEGRRKLVVFGCLAKRFGAELQKEIPEIDLLAGVGDEDRIAEYCSQNVVGERLCARPREGQPQGIDVPVEKRLPDKLTDTAYAFLKIAEGCDRGCSYCVIPDIRGAFKSRHPEDVLCEARDLVLSGKKELVIVAQDVTSYGKEIGYDLSRLVGDIASISGDFWIRLLYLYPTAIDDRLIEVISTEEKVCKYIDMPLQHVSPKILRLMGRGGSAEYFEKLILKMRSAAPEVNMRTTFIVGFPQETEDDFGQLIEFAREMKFERLGAFTYSKEEGTGASGMKGQVPMRVRKARYKRLMEVQSAISLEKNKRLRGRVFKALVDEVSEEVTVARIYSQAPEIDGVVLIEGGHAKKGEFVPVEILDAYDYDLKGKILR